MKYFRSTILVLMSLVAWGCSSGDGGSTGASAAGEGGEAGSAEGGAGAGAVAGSPEAGSPEAGSGGVAEVPAWLEAVVVPVVEAETAELEREATEQEIEDAWTPDGEVAMLERYWQQLVEAEEVTASSFDFDKGRGGILLGPSGEVGLFIAPNSLAEQESQIVRAVGQAKTATWLEYWAAGESAPVLTLVFATPDGVEVMTLEQFAAYRQLEQFRPQLFQRPSNACNDLVDGLCEDIAGLVHAGGAWQCALRSLPVLLRAAAPLCAPLVTAFGVGAPVCMGVLAGTVGAGLCLWATDADFQEIACRESVGCAFNNGLGLDDCSCMEFETSDCGSACSAVATGGVCRLVAKATVETSRGYRSQITSHFCRSIGLSGSRGPLSKAGNDCVGFLGDMCGLVAGEAIGDRVAEACACACGEDELSEVLACVACGDGLCRDDEATSCVADCDDGGPDGCQVVRDCMDPDAPIPPACAAASCNGDIRGHQGVATGDPHMRTFDGLKYDFQAVGEFTLLYDAQDELEVQIRTKPWLSRKDVSLNSAVAARVGADRIGFYRDGIVRLNGETVELADGVTQLPDVGSVYRYGSAYSVLWPDGSLLRLHPRGDFIEIEVFLVDARSGQPVGLLGNLDGTLEPELHTRGGEPVAKSPPFEEFYGVFAESWRVTQTSSLFDYAPGETTETFTDRAFPQRLASVEDLDALAAASALEICEAAGVTSPEWLEACVMDVGITGDSRFAEGLLRAARPRATLTVQPPADGDEDGVADPYDNCIAEPNSDQRDLDQDGSGNPCDPDLDGDGIANETDKCPGVADPLQQDSDGDGAGNACDTCPASNPDQADGDADGAGDICDNCPAQPNQNQANADNDVSGDACDSDDDNDLVDDGVDNCPQVRNPNQSDADQDGLGDACDGLEQGRVDILEGGGLVAAGVGFAGRGGAPRQSADIVLADIPTGSTIVDAQLYYVTIGGARETLAFNGTQLAPTLIGTAGDTCWNRPAGNFAYRADVTALVAGNGTYTLSGFPSQASGLDGQGASLLVRYTNPQDFRRNLIVTAENIATALSGVAMTSTLRGFTVPDDFDRAFAVNVVGDGQPFPDNLAFNAINTGMTDAFPGRDGQFWDTLTSDVRDYINPGDQSFAARVTATNDCLVWVVSALVIEGYQK